MAQPKCEAVEPEDGVARAERAPVLPSEPAPRRRTRYDPLTCAMGDWMFKYASAGCESPATSLIDRNDFGVRNARTGTPVYAATTAQLNAWSCRQLRFPPATLTRTHLQQHLHGRQKAYYLSRHASGFAFPMIDVDAHHGETDAPDVAAFIEAAYFPGIYREPSPRGEHLYAVVRTEGLSPAAVNRLMGDLKTSLRAAVRSEGFRSTVDVTGTMTTWRDGLLSRGLLAAVPFLPRALRDFERLASAPTFTLADVSRCVRDGLTRAEFDTSLEHIDARLRTQSQGSSSSALRRRRRSPHEFETSDCALERMRWASYQFARLPTVPALLTLYEEHYQTHPADTGRRQRAEFAIRVRRRSYDAEKAASARYHQQRDDLLSAVRVHCQDRSSKLGRPITDEDLAIALFVVTAGSFTKHAEPEMQWTIGHAAVIGMFARLRNDGETTATCSNRHKSCALLGILQRARLIELLDSGYVPSGGSGISRKWIIGTNHPRAQEFRQWSQCVSYSRVADRPVPAVERSFGANGRQRELRNSETDCPSGRGNVECGRDGSTLRRFAAASESRAHRSNSAGANTTPAKLPTPPHVTSPAAAKSGHPCTDSSYAVAPFATELGGDRCESK